MICLFTWPFDHLLRWLMKCVYISFNLLSDCVVFSKVACYLLTASRAQSRIGGHKKNGQYRSVKLIMSDHPPTHCLSVLGPGLVWLITVAIKMQTGGSNQITSGDWLSHYHISPVGSLPQLLALLPYSLAGLMGGRMGRESISRPVVIEKDNWLVFVFLVYKCYELHMNMFV